MYVYIYIYLHIYIYTAYTFAYVVLDHGILQIKGSRLGRRLSMGSESLCLEGFGDHR